MWIEETVDRESQQKLYVQIYQIIKSRIEKGEWPEATHIPSEDELCRMFNVSKATIRLAISELVREGYLRRQQGNGTFVSSTVPHSGMAMKTRLTEEVFGEGVTVDKELIAKGVKEPPEEIKTFLLASEDVFYTSCKGLVDGEPVYLKELFVPVGAVPGIEQEDVCQTTFYDIIQEKASRKISKVIQTIEVAAVTGESARILMVTEGSPSLLIHRLLVGSDGKPIAYTRLLGSGTKYKVLAEFERIR